jgi:Cdc6-like AAA superfamily ATPase
VAQWLTDEVGGGPLFRLNKQELSEAVGRRRPVLVGRREDRLLDPGESLADVFVEEAGRSLLVLGEPGSGKSVLLHRLA